MGHKTSKAQRARTSKWIQSLLSNHAICGEGVTKLNRSQKAAAVRRAVTSTKEFTTWWSARRQLSPMPSDPYRAFMIDRGLYARLEDRDIWKPRTNRTDLVPVDNAQGERRNRNVPVRHHKAHAYKPAYTPVAARPRQPLNEKEKAIVAHMQKMADHYHVAMPDIFFEKGHEGVYSHGDYLEKPYIVLGKNLNDLSMPMAKARAAHEMGHHVHAQGIPAQFANKKFGDFKQFTTTRNDKERAAWLFADPFMTDQRPIQKWRKKVMLGTYLGTSNFGRGRAGWGNASSAVFGEVKKRQPKRKKRK